MDRTPFGPSYPGLVPLPTSSKMNHEFLDNLPSLVARAFTAARQSESLIFSHTELATIQTRQGTKFQLRYCPALAKKPTSKTAPTKPKPDPFLNPPSDLLIANLPDNQNPTHILVLNKYPVIPNHFILATHKSKPQTDLLEEDDLAWTYACVKAWQRNNDKSQPEGQRQRQRRLFAFFNSGEHSGASQAHRHVQFLPIEDMTPESSSSSSDTPSPTDWQPLIDHLISHPPPEPPNHSPEVQIHRNPHPTLPFTHFAARLSPAITPSSLHVLYTRLYALAASSSTFTANHPSPRTISYNLALTSSTIAICPRRAEGVPLLLPPIPSPNSKNNEEKGEEEAEEGFIALNGTLLAGTLMVKGQREWDVLRSQAGGLDEVLKGVGVPVMDRDGEREGGGGGEDEGDAQALQHETLDGKVNL
ncbi:MAG: hypothetical protein Q9227_005339 [Pyrenula ochraceoflavens]